MPFGAPHPCPVPTCPELVTGSGRCPTHSRERRAEGGRGTAYERGYGTRWRAYRLTFLAAHPLCATCLEQNPSRVTAATVVDHVKAHKGDPVLFWDEANHRPSCKPHHDARVDEGDFGR